MPSEEKPIPGDKSDDAEDGSVSKIEGSSFSNYLASIPTEEVEVRANTAIASVHIP